MCMYGCASEKMEYMYANISVYIYYNRSGLPFMEHTHIYGIYINTINECIYIHAHSDIEDRITDACVPHMRAHVCARIRAQTCESFPPAWTTACGSARRRSTRLRRSTQTSARGTPRRSGHCALYAPLFGRRTRSAGLRCGTAAPPMRVRACAHTYRHSLARLSTCA